MSGLDGARALTLHRPWTTCITDLPDVVAKRIENRSWGTGYRGPVLIHAGQRWDARALTVAAEAVRALNTTVVVPDDDGDVYGPGADMWLSPIPDDHPGGFVAVATLADVCDESLDSPALLCDCGPWAFPGMRHWVLASVQVLAEPVSWSGWQGLWAPPQTALDLVAAQLGELVTA